MGGEVKVNLKECFARVIYDDEEISYNRLPEREAQKLWRLAMESVEAAGASLEDEGTFRGSGELCRYVEQLHRKGFV